MSDHQPDPALHRIVCELIYNKYFDILNNLIM